MRHWLVLGLLAATVLAAGCTTMDVHEGTAPAQRVVTPGTQARLDSAGYVTPGLERRVAVERTDALRTANNTLEICCTLRNRTEYAQKVQVRTQYLADDRAVLEGPDAWQPVYLPPNGIETYRTYSRGAEAAHYYIEVMELVSD